MQEQESDEEELNGNAAPEDIQKTQKSQSTVQNGMSPLKKKQLEEEEGDEDIEDDNTPVENDVEPKQDG